MESSTPLPEKKKIAWTPSDAEQTRNFLGSVSGQRFLSRLMYSAPEYGKFTSIEERAVTSGKIEGYGDCVAEIIALQEPDQE